MRLHILPVLAATATLFPIQSTAEVCVSPTDPKVASPSCIVLSAFYSSILRAIGSRQDIEYGIVELARTKEGRPSFRQEINVMIDTIENGSHIKSGISQIGAEIEQWQIEALLCENPGFADFVGAGGVGEFAVIAWLPLPNRRVEEVKVGDVRIDSCGAK